jgi:hypothetical protein
MASLNLQRGFNRLFLVLTVLWMLYWTVVYPVRRCDDRMELATSMRMQAENNCFENRGPEKTDCLKASEVDAKRVRGDVPILAEFEDDWPTILIMGIGVPPLVYGLTRSLIRGLSAVSLWIWRGFKAAPERSKSV